MLGCISAMTYVWKSQDNYKELSPFSPIDLGLRAFTASTVPLSPSLQLFCLFNNHSERYNVSLWLWFAFLWGLVILNTFFWFLWVYSSVFSGKTHTFIQVLCPVLDWIIWFLLLSCLSALYLFWNVILLVGYMICKYFLQFHGSPLHCVGWSVPSPVGKRFALMQSCVFISAFVACVLWCPFKDLQQPSDCHSQWILPIVSLAFYGVFDITKHCSFGVSLTLCCMITPLILPLGLDASAVFSAFPPGCFLHWPPRHLIAPRLLSFTGFRLHCVYNRLDSIIIHNLVILFF